MGMQSLPATSRFKLFNSVFTILVSVFIISVLGVYSATSGVYAVTWFATYGGVLSGRASGNGIVNNGIPSSGLPAGFYSDVVQHKGSGGMTTFGTLVSSADQQVGRISPTGSTDDAYAKNTGVSLVSPAIADALAYPDVISIPRPGLPCAQVFKKTLDASKIYKITTKACLTSVLSSGSGYELNSGKLAVIILSGADVDTFVFNGSLTSLHSDQRILFLTDAKVQIKATVGSDPATLNIDGPPNIEAAIISTAAGTPGFEVLTAATNPLVLEGPIVAESNVTLTRAISGKYPGVYIKYNPLYVVELSKMAPSLPPLKGLFESRTTWKYE